MPSHFWTEIEDNYLIANYESQKTREISIKLNRSIGSIHQRCNEFGLRKKRLNGKEKALARKFQKIRASAKERNLEFNLEEDFVKKLLSPCFYCGFISKTLQSGLDRMDCNQGYLMNNVVSACRSCNFGKYTLTVQEYFEHCKKVVEHLTLKGS